MAMAVAPHGGHAGSGQVHPVGPQAGHAVRPADIIAGAAVQPVSRELVFVDTSLPDYRQLVAAVNSLNSPQRQINIVLLNDSDGIQQISKTLSQYHNLDAVCFLSHGTGDSVDLSGTWLQAGNLNAYAGQIAGWRNALSEGGSLLFYGCDLAARAAGRTLLQDIHALTGAGVAANTGATGNLSQGGDWTLNYQLGNVNTALPFNPGTMAAWDGLMNTYIVSNTNDSGAGSLRNAIQLANSHPGLNTITFAIAGGGPETIDLLTALPVISNSVIIDGTEPKRLCGHAADRTQRRRGRHRHERPDNFGWRQHRQRTGYRELQRIRDRSPQRREQYDRGKLYRYGYLRQYCGAERQRRHLHRQLC